MAVPTVTGLDPASGPEGTLVVITGTDFLEDASAVHFGTYSAGLEYSVISDTQISCIVPAGTGTVTVKVTTSGGQNSSGASFIYSSYEGGSGSAPTVTSVTPNSSAYFDGHGTDQVAIVGTGFTTARAVYFGPTLVTAVQATFNVVSSTQITAWAPQGEAGVQAYVFVETNYGTNSNLDTANDFMYPASAVPTLTSVVPASGFPGDEIVLTGTNFSEATYVSWGTLYAGFRIDSSTVIRATVPGDQTFLGSAVNVYVSNPWGISADTRTFTYGALVAKNLKTSVSLSDGFVLGKTPNDSWGVKGSPFTVTATLSAAYSGMPSGSVDSTWYRLDNGNDVKYVSGFSVTGEGSHKLEYWSVGKDGYVEPTNVGYINIVGTKTIYPSATPTIGAIVFSWDPIGIPGESYLVFIEANPNPTPPPPAYVTTGTSLTYQFDYGSSAVYCRLKTVDPDGTISGYSATVGPVSSLQSVATDIADDAITGAKMAPSIMPPHIESSLPVLPNDEYPTGSLVYLTTDKRLYRNDGGGPNTNTHTNKATWYDRSGSGNNGTLNSFGYTEASGWDGVGMGGDLYALQFGGTDDRVNLTPIQQFTDKVWTMEFWVRNLNAAASQQLGFFGQAGATTYVGLNMSSGNRPSMGVRSTSGTTLFSPASGYYPFYDGLWHHVVGCGDGTYFRCYLDGVQCGTDTAFDGGTFNTADIATLGRTEFATPAAYFTGSMAAVRVYDRCLSAAEVAAQSALGPTSPNYSTSSLILDLNAKRALLSNAWTPVIDAAEMDGIISGNLIQGNSITAGQMSVGAIGAGEIAANAVYAKHLIVADYENLIPNANSEVVPTYTRDTSITSADVEFRGVASSDAYRGLNQRRIYGIAAGTVQTIALCNPVPCKGTDWFHFYAMTKCQSDQSPWGGRVQIVGMSCNSSGVFTDVDSAESSWQSSTTYTERTIDYNVAAHGATVTYVQARLSASSASNVYVDFDELLFRKKVGGTLVVEGSIVADHIASNTLVATKISGGEIYGGKITGATVNVESELLMGTATENGTITLAGSAGKTGLLRTTSVANVPRIELQSGAYAGYLKLFTGLETGAEGKLYVTGNATSGTVALESPEYSTYGGIDLTLYDSTTAKYALLGGASRDDNTTTRIRVDADGKYIELQSPTIDVGNETVQPTAVNVYGPVFIPKLQPSYDHAIFDECDFMLPAGAYIDKTVGRSWYMQEFGDATPTMTTLAVQNHPGVAKFTTGTSSTTGYQVQTSALAMEAIVGDFCEFVFRLPYLTSTQQMVYLGFMDQFSGSAPTKGAYVLMGYHSGDGGYRFVASSNATAGTTRVTAAVGDTGVWWKLRIEIGATLHPTFTLLKDGAATAWDKYEVATAVSASYGHGFCQFSGSATPQNNLDMDYMNYYLVPRDR